MKIHFRHQDGAKHGHHGSPTLANYVQSIGQNGDLDPVTRRVLIDICQGPVESGKTLGSIAKIYYEMCTMPRCKDGIRRSKWLIYRATYPELKETVVPDFLEWFPEAVYGEFSENSEPMTYKMRFADVEAEVVFMALDPTKESYKKKLRSFICTGAYGNELQFQSLELFNAVTQRTGRYPSRSRCPDYDRKKRHFGDLNAPESHEHWILYMRGDTAIPPDMPADQAMAYKKPEGWAFYVQPEAVHEVMAPDGSLQGYVLNPMAENLQNMGDDPYIPALGGLTRDQIDRDYRNVTRARKSGAMRYPGFSRERHVSKSALIPDPRHPIIMGADGGASPAVTFWQKIDGQWRGLGVLTKTNLTTTEFAPMVVDYISERFPFVLDEDGPGLIAWGDPNLGWQAEQGAPSVQVYAKNGIDMQTQWAKDRPKVRHETGRRLLSEFPDGRPRVILCGVHARKLIPCFENATMRTRKIPGSEVIVEEIVKNNWSHPVEATEYAWCGGGEARETLNNPNRPKRSGPINTTGQRGRGARKSWTTLRAS
ncbi:MAG: hypothetical protein JKP96_06660 [Oceanicaulis sp.]|jgi:hypothetical protein|nr:hypothetical protein [Oceanicaulis sp.]